MSLFVALGASLFGSHPTAAAAVQTICVRPTPTPEGVADHHPVIAGVATTLKGIVKSDLTGLTFQWEFGDGSPPLIGTVTDPYRIEAEHVYGGPVGTTYLARLSVVDATGAFSGTDSYSVRIVATDPSLVDAASGRIIAIEKALWWAHKQLVRYEGSMGAEGYIDWEPGPRPLPIPAPASGAPSIIVAQGFVDNGYKVAGAMRWDPVYTEDAQRLVNYVVGRLETNPIGIKGDGSPQYPYLNPENRSGDLRDGLGVYFNGNDLEYEQGAVLRLLARSGYADAGFVYHPANPRVSQWTFREVLQQMVDFLAWSQLYRHAIDYKNAWDPAGRTIELNPGASVPGALRGSWPYWWEGFTRFWEPNWVRGMEGDVALAYWAVDGIRAAQKRGAVVPAFVKAELRRFLTNNQDLSGTPASNPYHGELYFGPARAHHLLERAGEGLLLFAWLGLDSGTPEVQAALGFIDRFWNQHNYSHFTSWPWDPTQWERNLPPNFSHFKRGALYEVGHWRCELWDPTGGTCQRYAWQSTGFIDELNIFAFLALTQGLQAQSQTDPARMAHYPNACNYQQEYLELICRNQLADGNWDDSAWTCRMTQGQGWGLMLLARLMADNDQDGWYSDADCDDDDPAVNPGAPELCNGIDDNCNGRIDEGCIFVAPPLLEPPGGRFTTPRTVTLSSPTPGANIRYTLDGSLPTPTHGSTVPNGGTVLVDCPATLLAAAVLEGTGSAIASGEYLFQAADPVFSPGAGLHPLNQLVKITSATPGARIAYTTDGSTPGRSNGMQAGSGTSLALSGGLVLKALAYLPLWEDSAVTSAAYTVTMLRAEAPVFTPGPASYAAPQSVAITTATGGAAIRYTTDGTTPTPSNGTLIQSGGAVAVERTTTLRAVAFAEAVLDSAVAVASYTMKAAGPVLAPAPGTYFDARSVTLTTATPGARIRYTTDGTLPSSTVGAEIGSGESVLVDRTLVLRAVAWRDGWTTSAVVGGTYTFRASLPLLSQPGGTFADSRAVVITSPTPAAQIRYTTDGTLPTETTGTPLTNGSTLLVDRSLALKAIACREGWTPTSAVSATYTLKAATPVLAPPGTTYSTPQSVTIRSATPETLIRYTTDGTLPSQTHGTEIGSGVGVLVDRTLSLKAVAFRPGWTDTSVVSGTYTFRTAVPVLSQPGGTFADSQYVEISSPTPLAQILYTTDGTLPSLEAGLPLVNRGTLLVDRSLTLKAITYREGWTPSGAVSATYTFKAAAPVLAPFGTTSAAPLSVTITSATPGTLIRFTTDGTLPSQTHGTEIGSGVGVLVDRTLSLKAVAFRPGWTDTSVVSGTYTFRTALPVLSQPGGTCADPRYVTITSPTPLAQIRYSTDGTLPSATDGAELPNGGTLLVDRSLTLKAVACREGWTPTSAVSATYTLKAATPALAPLGTTYSTPQSVTITSATPATQIRYTTDGTLPSQTHGEEIASGGGVLVDRALVLRAVAFRPGWTDTSVVSGTYTFRSSLPALSQPGGVYADSQYVVLASPTPLAQIRYTTDGTLPSATLGTEFFNGGTLLVDRSLALKAVACREGWTPTSAVSATYTLKAAPPVFSTLPTTYSAPQSVTISTATPGGSISYTTDGTLPSQTHGTVIAGGDSVLLERTAVLKAVAFKPGWTDTGVVSGSYTFRASFPVLSQLGGLYSEEQNVTITSSTPGAQIRYTTDGTTLPTDTVGALLENGGTVTVNRTLALKAIACREGWTPTSVAGATYTLKAATPAVSPPGTTYYTPPTVTISTATPGGSISYTTDGTLPSQTHGTVIAGGGSVLLERTAILKAVAFKPGWTDTSAASGSYTLRASLPTFSPPGGLYFGAQSVTISSTTPAARIRYTTDGTIPTATSGTEIASGDAVPVDRTLVLRAIAARDGWGSTSVASGSYTIKEATVTAGP